MGSELGLDSRLKEWQNYHMLSVELMMNLLSLHTVASFPGRQAGHDDLFLLRGFEQVLAQADT